MIGEIIAAIFIGIVAGFLGRLLMPGKDPMGFFATILLGLAGSVVGFLVFTELLGIGDNEIFDPVGGSRFDESVRALATEGRLVVIGFTEGSIPSVAVNRLLFRNVSVVGAAWGAFAFERQEYVREVDEDLRRMVAAGHVRPLIGRRYPLERVRDALEDLDGRRGLGKIVLDIDQEGAA